MPRRPDPFGSPFPGSGLFDPWGRRPRRTADPRVELERRRRAEMEERRRQALLREQRERELARERRRVEEEARRRAEALEAQQRREDEARLREALEQDAERHRDRWEDGGPLDPREPETEPENDNAATAGAERHHEDREPRRDAPSSSETEAIADEVTFESVPAAAFDESTEIARVRARLERSAERETEAQRRAVLTDMLEVLDDLDRALQAGQDDAPLTQGVALVRDNFLRKLERHGVTRGDDARGMTFDPERHTAIGTAPVSPERDGTLVEVLGPAYFVGDELLRAAQVIVGRA